MVGQSHTGLMSGARLGYGYWYRVRDGSDPI